MGERIKDLGEFKIGGYMFKVELNHGNKNEKYNIHIQNDIFKIAYKEREFAKFVGGVIEAKERLKKMKGMKDE